MIATESDPDHKSSGGRWQKYVFAVYRSPENFVRKDIDKNQDNVDDDTIISERIVTLKVELNSSSPIQKEIKLVRPMV